MHKRNTGQVIFYPNALEEFSSSFLCRLASRLLHDQSMVLHPDVDSPFADQLDVIRRLLPYHLFQYPKEDLDAITAGKGKEKAVEQDWREEIRGMQEQLNRHFYLLMYHPATRLALDIYKRRDAVRERWRRLNVRSGKVKVTSCLSNNNLMAQAVCYTS